MELEAALKRLEELRQAQGEILAQLNAIQGIIGEYERFIIPALQKKEETP